MKKILQKIKKNQKLIIMSIVFLLGIFAFSNFVLAAEAGKEITGADDLLSKAGGFVFGAIGSVIATVVGVIVTMITTVIGLIITVLVKILIDVANFNNIINIPVVATGWVIIRDLCNMFFVLIFLVIAFSTILRIESYNAKKTLPKLLIMAVMINFSKTIFGLMVDFSTVVMLTFTSSFADGGGYFVKAFQMDNWLSFPTGGYEEFDKAGVSQWTTVLAMFASVVASVITLIVVVVMLAVLIMRVIFLWIYTMLSPLVFLGWAFPPLQKYTGEIWEDFIKQLIVGPVLGFFLWMSLFVVSQHADTLNMSYQSSTQQVCAASAFFCNKDFQRFLLTIGLLMGGLSVAQKVGGAAGSIVGSGKAWADKTIKGAQGLVMAGPKAAPHAIGRNMLDYGGKGLSRIGLDGVGGFVTDWGKNMKSNNRKKQSGIWQKRLESAGLGENNLDAIHSLLTRPDVNNPAKSVTRGGVPGDFIFGDVARGAEKSIKTRRDAREFVRGQSLRQNDPNNPDAFDVMRENVGNMYNTDKMKHILDEASSGDARAMAFVDNIREDIRRANIDPDDKGNKNFVIGWAKALATYEKSGKTLGGQLQRIKAEIESGSIVSNIDSLKGTITPSYMIVDADGEVKRGDGGLKAGSFGRGKSNLIQADLDRLGVRDLLPAGHSDFSKVAGVNIEERGQINNIANNLLGAINEKISLLKSAGANGNNNAEMRGLLGARDRLSNPGDLNNLQLVNTGIAREYQREGIAHETVHGAGIANEQITDSLAKQAMGSGGIANYRRESLARNKTPDDIILNEGKILEDGDINVVAEVPGMEELSKAIAKLNSNSGGGMDKVAMNVNFKTLLTTLKGIKGEIGKGDGPKI